MKKTVSIILSLLLLASFVGCGKKDDKSAVNIYGIAGPTGVGLVNLINNDGNYNFKIAASNDEIVAKISNKEADIAAVATNLAASLYNKTNGGVKVLAVNTLGVLNLVTKGEKIESVADLKGKTVYSVGQGANPEYIFKSILKSNSLNPEKDVKIKFVSQPAELLPKILANKKAIAVAPQPVATAITVKDKDARIALDFNTEWNKFNKTKLVMGAVVVRKEFAEKNPETVEKFMNDYKASIEKVNADTEKTAKLCEQYGIITPAAIAQKAIPYCNIVFENGDNMKTDLSAYLKFLYDANQKSIGGKLPENDFYY